MQMLTEDKVRDEVGRKLGLVDTKDIQAGVGQITTFNQLGIAGWLISRMGGICPMISLSLR